MPKQTLKVRTSPGGTISYKKIVPRKKKATDHSKAWAKAAQQYAGNIYGLPGLHSTHPNGPGPVARGAETSAVHSMPVTNKPAIPKTAPGPGPSAPAGSKIKSFKKRDGTTVQFAAHTYVKKFDKSRRLSTDLDKLMASPPRKRRTKA
jgi:hypothetical protein